MKELLYGSYPNDLPAEGILKDVYVELCGVLNIESDVNSDWRCIMDEMGADMTLIHNTQKLTPAQGDSPANFALRNYLYKCLAGEIGTGSDDLVLELEELFKKRQLHSALHCLKTCKGKPKMASNGHI